MTEYNNLSVDELNAVIGKAKKALNDKKSENRKKVISEIKKLAASIDIKVNILDGTDLGLKERKKVAAKYRNPDDPSQTWAGRGVAPRWMQALLKSGRSKSEFLI